MSTTINIHLEAGLSALVPVPPVRHRFVGDSSRSRASLSLVRAADAFVSSLSRDGMRLNSKGERSARGRVTFRERERERERERQRDDTQRKGVARESIRKYQTGNCSADCVPLREDTLQPIPDGEWFFVFYIYIYIYIYIEREREKGTDRLGHRVYAD